jgi:hypothetical protein
MFGMFRKTICLVSFVLALSMVGNVQAIDVVQWTDVGFDHFWSNPDNWNTGTVPAANEKFLILESPGATIANEGAVAQQGQICGDNGLLTLDGGSLTISEWLLLGSYGAGGTINIKSGTLTVKRLDVGHVTKGELNMTGGSLIISGQYLEIGGNATATGHVQLDAGIITTPRLSMRRIDGSVGTMDIKTGTLIINGNSLSTVQGFIDKGWITAYGGNGMLHLDYDVTNEGKTTLRAIHNLNPNPADGGVAAPGEVELSWTLPDPCVAGELVLVDVYFTDNWAALYSFTDPAAIRIVSQKNVSSVTVQTQPKKQYYWAIDTYIGDPNDPILGPIFSFVADNSPPEVDAGKDVVTWLTDGIRTVNLDSTVTDDGAVGPYTVQWTVISEPNDPNNPYAVIADPTAEDTSITTSALGEYVLQLEASDGEYASSDTVTINVYSDGCEAAQSLPDYEPFPGDLNGDCKVDELDLDILNEDWLKDNSLTEDALID